MSFISYDAAIYFILYHHIIAFSTIFMFSAVLKVTDQPYPAAPFIPAKESENLSGFRSLLSFHMMRYLTATPPP